MQTMESNLTRAGGIGPRSRGCDIQPNRLKDLR